MLKVLHVTNAYPYPEVPEYGIFVKEQINSLNETNEVVSELVFINGRRNGKRAYIDAVKEIRRKARGCDIIHCHHLYSGFAAAAAMTGKPLVVSFLNDWLNEMDGVKSLAVRRIGCSLGVSWADRVIFKSPVPSHLGNKAKFVHLPNGANLDQFHIGDRRSAREQLGLDQDAIYILFVSSKDIKRPQKRYDRFHAVVNAVRAALPHRNIQELLLVNQPRERVPAFFNAADLHLMTSDYEGSPNSVKEALCCGIPVVTTNVGNVEEMLDNVPTCKVSTSFDADQISRLVYKILSESVDRQAIRRGFERKNLTREVVAQKLLGIYREVL